MDDDWSWLLDVKWRWLLLEKKVDPADCILIYDRSSSPIVYAIWNIRYCRVEYVYAEISRYNRDGEKTSDNPKLAAVVRNRGIPNDHCGHLVGAQFGGRMTFYNLVPQNGYINSGFGREARWYWSYIDSFIADRLQRGESTFEIQYAPIYDDNVSNTRPTQIHVLQRQTCNGEIRVMHYIAPNSMEMEGVQVSSRGSDILPELSKIIAEWQSKQCKSDDLKMYKRFDGDPDLDKEFNCFGEKKQKDANQSSTQHENSESSNSKNNSKSASSNQNAAEKTNPESSNSKYNSNLDSGSKTLDSHVSNSDSDLENTNGSSSNSSFWEIKRRPNTVKRVALESIPVVSSVVDIIDAAEDFEEGRVLQGSVNLVFGVFGLFGGTLLGGVKHLNKLRYLKK